MSGDERLRHGRTRLAPGLTRLILESLGLAVFVYNGTQLEYANAAARRLIARVRRRYNVAFLLILGDHLNRLGLSGGSEVRPVASILTAPGGEPFHLQVVPFRRAMLSVTVREVGADLEAFRSQYRLSAREAQVAELVAHGYRTRDVAITLGIAPETAKKHLQRVYEKVGVESRVQLTNRLA